jgi:hypothetical protein
MTDSILKIGKIFIYFVSLHAGTDNVKLIVIIRSLVSFQ